MSKKFLITEQERKHILGLYGLINEVETTGSAADLKLDQKIEFGPGYYNPKFSYTSANGTTYNWDVDATLKPGLDKIKEFLKNNPTGYVVDVTLESGESKIPNNDVMEGRKQVEPGYLNTARLTTLKEYLNPIFKSWNDEGIKTDFKINEKTTIGPTEWVGTPFCPAGSDAKTQRGTCYNNYLAQLSANNSEVIALKDKYNSEQYFRVIINVNKTEATPEPEPVPTIDPSCAAGLQIRIYVPDHNCQNAEFFLFANKTLLYNSVGGYTANLNNAKGMRGVPTFSNEPMLPAWLLNPGYGDLKNGDGTYDYGYGISKANGDIGGGRSDTFTVTPEQSAEIVKDGKIDFYFICTTDDAHDDIPVFEVLKDGQPLVDEYGNPVPNPIEDIDNVKGRLFTTDACGKTLIYNSERIGEEDEAAYASLRAQYVSVLVAEREKMKNDSSIANKFKRIFSDEPDSKGVDLSRADTLKTKMLELLNKIINGDYDYIDTDEEVTNPNYQKYYTEFYNLLYKKDAMSFERDGGINGGGPYSYTDKTLDKDKFFGDIRRRLNEFYQAFDAIYFDDVNNVFVPTGIKKRTKIKSNVKNYLPAWSEYLKMGT